MMNYRFFLLILTTIVFQSNIKAQETITLNGWFLNYRYFTFCGEDCLNIENYLIYISNDEREANSRFQDLIYDQSQLKALIDTGKIVFYHEKAWDIFDRKYKKDKKQHDPFDLMSRELDKGQDGCYGIYTPVYSTGIQKLKEGDFFILMLSLHHFNLGVVHTILENEGRFYINENNKVVFKRGEESLEGYIPIEYKFRGNRN